MSRVKLGLSGLNAVELVEKASVVVNLMTGNPNFVTPIPSLASITTLVDELDVATEEAESGSHNAIDIRNQKFALVMTAMRTLGAYVQAASNGVEAIITSSGFEVVAPRNPVGLPEQVANMAAVSIGLPGSVDLKWKSLRTKADSYVVYATQGDPVSLNAQWEVVGYSSKAAFTVEDLLNRNQYYWFAVVAINSAGEGPMSNPAKCMVL